MDKRAFGKLLGELYRMQSALGMNCPATPGQIYGLLNGFETVIDEELDGIGSISAKKFDAVIDVLNHIWADEDRLAEFKGYYDIEGELTARGVDRIEAIRIIRYLKANGQFLDLIQKMNSQYSPVECKTFELDEWNT